MTLLTHKFFVVCALTALAGVGAGCRIADRCVANAPTLGASTAGCGDGRIEQTFTVESCCATVCTGDEVCTSGGPACVPYTIDNGDGTETVLDCLHEQCDDGNTNNGDGCSDTCQLEGVTYAVDGATFSNDTSVHFDTFECLYPAYIDLTLQSWVAFDIFVTPEGAITEVPFRGFAWEANAFPFLENFTTCCITRGCGNGLVNCEYTDSSGTFHPEEECDDGNTVAGDGCAADCTIEVGWDCYNGDSLTAEPADCYEVPNFVTPEDEVGFLVEWYNQSSSNWLNSHGWAQAVADASSITNIDCKVLSKNETLISCLDICNQTDIVGFDWGTDFDYTRVFDCDSSTYDLVQVEYGFLDNPTTLESMETINSIVSTLHTNLLSITGLASTFETTFQGAQKYHTRTIENDEQDFSIIIFNITTRQPADASIIATAITDTILDTWFSNFHISAATKGNLFTVRVGCNQLRHGVNHRTFHKQICDNCCREACRNVTLLSLYHAADADAIDDITENCTLIDRFVVNGTGSLFGVDGTLQEEPYLNQTFGPGFSPILTVDYSNVSDPCGFCRSDESCPVWYGLTCGDCFQQTGDSATTDCGVVFRVVTHNASTTPGDVHVLSIDMRANGIQGDMISYDDPVHIPIEEQRQLSVLTRLQTLNLLENQISNLGVGIDWSLMTQLMFIDFRDNLLVDSTFLNTLYHVTTLKELHLQNNRLQGEIDANAFATTECSSGLSSAGCVWNQGLSVLDVRNNALSGTFPTSVSLLTNLVTFQTNNNNFDAITGFGPPQNVRSIDFKRNNIAGTIPENLLTCPVTPCKLLYLDISNNLFTGTIPISIGGMTSLVTLNLNDNALSGTLPDEIGDLTGLRSFYLQNNQLTRVLPLALRFMVSLSELDLSNNMFESPLPENVFTSLDSLRTLNFAANRFTTLDSSVWEMDSLETFDFSNNSVTAFPEYPTDLLENILVKDQKHQKDTRNLQTIRAHNNNIQVVPDLNPLPSLVRLSLDNNDISGQLSDIFNNPELEVLTMSNNSISGSLPPSWTTLSKLRKFDISRNGLQVALPENLETLTRLVELDLSMNTINSEIPPFMGSLTLLSSLKLQNNLFHGSMPSTIGNLVSLEDLDLSMNAFTGALPDLSALTKLRMFDISRNRFSGTIPVTTLNLPSLVDVNFFSNAFSGFLPIEITSRSYNINLEVSGNYWCPFPVDGPMVQLFTENVICEQCPQDTTAAPQLRCDGTTTNCNTCNSQGSCNGGASGSCVCSNSSWSGDSCSFLTCPSNCSSTTSSSRGSCVNRNIALRCLDVNTFVAVNTSEIVAAANAAEVTASMGVGAGGFSADQVAYALSVNTFDLTTGATPCVLETNRTLDVCSQQVGTTFSSVSGCHAKHFQVAFCRCNENEWVGTSCETEFIEEVVTVNPWISSGFSATTTFSLLLSFLLSSLFVRL